MPSWLEGGLKAEQELPCRWGLWSKANTYLVFAALF